MNNIFSRVLQPFEIKKERVLHSTDFPPGIVQQRHLEANLYAIKFGLAADRPATPGEDGSYFAYFATDTFVLSCWSGSAWKNTSLT